MFVVHVAGLVSKTWLMLPPVLPMSSQAFHGRYAMRCLVDGGLVKQASSAKASPCISGATPSHALKAEGQQSIVHLALCDLAANARCLAVQD